MKYILVSLLCLILIITIIAILFATYIYIKSNTTTTTTTPSPIKTFCPEQNTEIGILPQSDFDTIIIKDCSLNSSFTGVIEYKCLSPNGTWASNESRCIPEGIIDVNIDLSGKWSSLLIDNKEYGPVIISKKGKIESLIKNDLFNSIDDQNVFLSKYLLIAIRQKGYSIHTDLPYGKFIDSNHVKIYGGTWSLTR